MARLVTTLMILVFTMLVSTSVPVAAAESLAVVATQDNPIATSEESVAAGRTIYGRFCRSCHGQLADGRGMAAPAGSRPANLIDAEWDHGSSDAEIFKVIKEGIAPKYDMDAWEGRVSDDDMWHVINYLRDLATN